MAKDISKFDSIRKDQEEGLEVDILDPTGEPIGVKIRVAGPDSDRFRRAREKQIDNRIDARQIGPIKAAHQTLENVTFLSEITINWSEFQLDGTIYPFTTDNALKFYQRFPWAADQIDEKAGNRRVFIKPLRTDSEPPSETESNQQT